MLRRRRLRFTKKREREVRSEMVKKKRKPTEWNKHLDKVSKENPKLSLKEAMKKASESYKPKKKK